MGGSHYALSVDGRGAPDMAGWSRVRSPNAGTQVGKRFASFGERGTVGAGAAERILVQLVQVRVLVPRRDRYGDLDWSESCRISGRISNGKMYGPVV